MNHIIVITFIYSPTLASLGLTTFMKAPLIKASSLSLVVTFRVSRNFRFVNLCRTKYLTDIKMHTVKIQ